MYLAKQLIAHIRLGDWIILTLTVTATVWLFVSIWFTHDLSKPDHVIVRSGNQIIATILLPAHQTVIAHGPLGQTSILIDGYRARIIKDPSPRQYCVSQGWLSQPGDVSICLPNQIAIYMPSSQPGYDSVNY